VAFARFCQTRLLFGPPCGGLTCRRGRLHLMLRTGELLDPLKGLCHGASPVGSRLAAVVSYRAAWSLPGPDFHWLVGVILRKTTSPRRSTSFLRCPATGHAESGSTSQDKMLPMVDPVMKGPRASRSRSAASKDDKLREGVRLTPSTTRRDGSIAGGGERPPRRGRRSHRSGAELG
jgi:hypothetical protein